MEKQLVIFDLRDEHFGVDIALVESIIKMQAITPVPKTREYVEGIINLRGMVVPVIDLRKRLGIEIQENNSEMRIIVINQDEYKIGMIVDAVSEVLTIREESIEPTPAMVNTINTAYIVGIAKTDGRLIILLDLEKVLSEKAGALLGELASV